MTLAPGLHLEPYEILAPLNAAGKLHHTNIVPIYTTGEAGRIPLLSRGASRV